MVRVASAACAHHTGGGHSPCGVPPTPQARAPRRAAAQACRARAANTVVTATKPQGLTAQAPHAPAEAPHAPAEAQQPQCTLCVLHKAKSPRTPTSNPRGRVQCCRTHLHNIGRPWCHRRGVGCRVRCGQHCLQVCPPPNSYVRRTGTSTSAGNGTSARHASAARQEACMVLFLAPSPRMPRVHPPQRSATATHQE
ncbi:hypothetical protein GGX14DRAFT_600001 [Mycena pura]|uniref:Uncharacterized protein n=1 Tax=Mycena pura TaxID=153505 RepID=A0AAD6XZ57_9AGAR|nr:hypothetical protein GGX14DRAFT_600001 [Mycena pura]